MKRRKIIVWRLVLVLVVSIGIISGAIYGLISFNKFVAQKQYEQRMKYVIHTETINETRELTIIIDEPKQEPKLTYVGEFRLTGYCDCEECQEQWVGTTALGVAPTEEKTIAVDPSIIPLGSTVYIEGLGYRVAEDVGGMINDYDIDVFVGSHSECFDKSCNRQAKVYIVEEVNN